MDVMMNAALFRTGLYRSRSRSWSRTGAWSGSWSWSRSGSS